MGRMLISFPSQDTPVRRTLVTTQGTRRGTHCRLYGSCRCPPEARRLWHDANNTPARPFVKRARLPIHRPGLMRRHHNRLDLPAPDRPQVPNCLLLRQPHGPGCGRNSNSDPLRLHRCPSTNNRPRPRILSTILPC